MHYSIPSTTLKQENCILLSIVCRKSCLNSTSTNWMWTSNCRTMLLRRRNSDSRCVHCRWRRRSWSSSCVNLRPRMRRMSSILLIWTAKLNARANSYNFRRRRTKYYTRDSRKWSHTLYCNNCPLKLMWALIKRIVRCRPTILICSDQLTSSKFQCKWGKLRPSPKRYY